MREEEAEDCSVMLWMCRASHCYLALIFSDKILRYPQTQSRAANALSRKERFEHLRECNFVHPGAAVGDRNPHALFPRAPGSGFLATKMQ